MAQNNPTRDMIWHNDGHELILRIVKSELEIIEIKCPNDSTGDCWDEKDGCLVKWFISRFGMECNAGSCPAVESMKFCWTIVGDIRNLDAAQLWFMPTTDETFSAWLTANK